MFHTARKIILIVFIGCCLLYGSNTQGNTEISIIPKPVKLERLEGYFSIGENTKIIVDQDLTEVDTFAQQFAEKLRNVTGFPIPLFKTSDTTLTEDAIFLSTASANDTLGREGYKLSVTQGLIKMTADSAAGFFYGIQSLYQLMPVEIESSERIDGINWIVPCVKIEDKPRFQWRGVHLDVCRHFFPKEFIKKYIDMLAMYKMNTFHWHLTEDQGWRIEIKKHPKLTEIGAWRNETMGDGTPYGGFYTQEEVQEIVEYAKQRCIEIVPEIEMPGHSLAALAAYPELSCTGGPFEVATTWGVFYDVFCAGNDKTFEFLEDVLSEVVELFPGEFIHIGGDECPKYRWQNCEKCKSRINAEGLNNEHELQSYFIKRIEEFLNSRGKRLIGWDEILEGGLAPNAAVMSWRGTEGGIAAAKSGHDAVMTPTSHCYFDYYQALEGEPPAIGGYLPIEKVYSFEPIPAGLTQQESKHILGAQANVWTEYMPNSRHVEYMLFPRLCALSEVVWSPKEQRDYDDFTQRLEAHYDRLEAKDINYRVPPRSLVDENLVQKEYRLKQNYPNPFNSSTQIKYGLIRAGMVRLKVFDVFSREVATLVNGFQAAGVYNVNFDASHLASGMYIYRIETGSFTNVKKMMLIK